MRSSGTSRMQSAIAMRAATSAVPSSSSCVPTDATMTNLHLPERPRILVITLRRLGDVLLTTPLIRTLKAGFPGSSIAALVFRGTEGMLAGNPDVDEVVATSHRPSLAEMAALVRRLWRSYDLAVSTQAG